MHPIGLILTITETGTGHDPEGRGGEDALQPKPTERGRKPLSKYQVLWKAADARYSQDAKTSVDFRTVGLRWRVKREAIYKEIDKSANSPYHVLGVGRNGL